MAASATFVGSIPENYDRYIAQLIIEPFARDLAARIPTRGLSAVLELACGTGLLTQKLRQRLPSSVSLVASDLSEAMIEIARHKPGLDSGVEWKVADASALPFSDAAFDLVVIQFGFMFFPDKPMAAAEIHRVLKPGGRLLFSVWDRIERHEVADVAHRTVTELFAGDPPDFYQIPFSYFDQLEIRSTLRDAGFVDVAVTEVEKRLTGNPRDFATGLVRGNPIATELVERLHADLDEVTNQVERALLARLGGYREGLRAQARALVAGGRKPSTGGASIPVSAGAEPNPARAQPVRAPKVPPKTEPKRAAKPQAKPRLKPKPAPA